MAKQLPIVKELEPGTYYWCRCGKTENGAFCDGSHDEKDRGPLEFKVKEKKKVALCTCRQTKNAPICDGTHAKL